jgi:hypothetical protein
MSTFLTTLPINYGFYNLGTVQAYPTGGTGPTAYGPTSYFGSDPLPEAQGDSVYNPVDLGDFSSLFKTITLNSTHGGNTRVQSKFYKITLNNARSLFLTQNYSPTSYQANTNRNTIVSIYKIEDGTHRRELPINNSGYVYSENSVVDSDSYTSAVYYDDYPSVPLAPGTYILLVTNDPIRYQATTYSFNVNISITNFGLVDEGVAASGDFGPVVASVVQSVNFGSVVPDPKTVYPYSSTSGLGYTRAGVSL